MSHGNKVVFVNFQEKNRKSMKGGWQRRFLVSDQMRKNGRP